MTAATASALASPAQVLRLIDGAGILGLDLETTGLEPGRDRVRLLSLADGNRSVVLDCFEHDPRPLLPALRGRILVAHNAAFDLGFLWELGLTDLPETVCTYLLAQMLTAGEGGGGHGFGPCSLAACCLRYLGQVLPKDLQASDWSGPLSADQVEYARKDAEVVLPLMRRLDEEIDKAKLQKAAEVELRALRAFVWLARSGVPFDRKGWVALATTASLRKKALAEKLEPGAPPKAPDGLFGPVEFWNWDSPQQVATVFERLGHPLGLEYKGGLIDTTNDAALAVNAHPLADVLREHRHQSQLVKMYGAGWLADARITDGRLYPGWRQIGAASGRTSCEQPNMQQVPRDEENGRAVYRACVKAPPGRVLVKADYGQLQMRIACKWARDVALLNVFRTGVDVHTATARALLGKDEPSKAERQIAKSANFALLFGAGAEGLRVYCKTTFGIDLTEAEAGRHREAFFRTYAGLARWHEDARRRKVRETRSASGRRRVLHPTAPDTWRLNSPVQADEADGLKLALALLWERRHECPGAFPVLAVHDEIVCEADTDRAEHVRAWLVAAMEDGMRPWLEPVPVAVEARIVPTWGG